MTAFPQTIHFIGTNTPRRQEHTPFPLEVEGTIPPEIDGAFFRAVPDNAHAPLFEDDIALNADGMISKFDIRNGQVTFAIRYVETERYLAERKAGKALFGRYRNPFTDDPSVAGIDRTVANTTPVWHAGRLFMTKEDGRAFELDPETLATIGKWDFYGALKSETFTAHPRIDLDTGEMFFFGYEAGGLCSRDVAYGIADKDGNLVSEQWFEAPYCASIHDFCITERFAIFPIFPTTADLDRLKAGGAHWAHEQERESWIGVMPRYGTVEEMRWFEGPKGVSAFHMINAWEEGDTVHVDLCLTDTNAFPFMREAGGIHRNQWEVEGALTRWSVDMGTPQARLVETKVGPPGDLPRIPDADQGRRHARAWMPSMNPAMQGPPMLGGPVGFNFNALLRMETASGAVTMLELPPGAAISEPAHVSPHADGSDGWLMCVVDLPNSPMPGDYLSELWFLEADAIEKGPISKARLGIPLRSQVHGTWVGRDRLTAAKAQSTA